MKNIENELDKIIEDLDDLGKVKESKTYDEYGCMPYHTHTPNEYTHISSYSNYEEYRRGTSHSPNDTWSTYREIEVECNKCKTTYKIACNEYVENINYSTSNPYLHEHLYKTLYCIRCGITIEISNGNPFEVIDVKVGNLLSNKIKGVNNPFYGKHHLEETKEK